MQTNDVKTVSILLADTILNCVHYLNYLSSYGNIEICDVVRSEDELYSELQLKLPDIVILNVKFATLL